MWNPVRYKAHFADMETSYLHLRTYSDVSSGDITFTWVGFYDKERRIAGGIGFQFGKPYDVVYGLIGCRYYYTPFPTSLPAEDVRHWVIEKHGYRIVIFCNGELALNITVSSDMCVDTWETYWRREVDVIRFDPNGNTATDSFYIGWLIVI